MCMCFCKYRRNSRHRFITFMVSIDNYTPESQNTIILSYSVGPIKCSLSSNKPSVKTSDRSGSNS